MQPVSSVAPIVNVCLHNRASVQTMGGISEASGTRDRITHQAAAMLPRKHQSSRKVHQRRLTYLETRHPMYHPATTGPLQGQSPS